MVLAPLDWYFPQYNCLHSCSWFQYAWSFNTFEDNPSDTLAPQFHDLFCSNISAIQSYSLFLNFDITNHSISFSISTLSIQFSYQHLWSFQLTKCYNFNNSSSQMCRLHLEISWSHYLFNAPHPPHLTTSLAWAYILWWIMIIIHLYTIATYLALSYLFFPSTQSPSKIPS